MVTINWCLKQSRGIELVKPNDNLAKEYLSSSEETLFSLKNSNETSNMWKATKKYYAEYLAVYALMMKLGIKCEIHDCTIEITKLLKDIFPKNTYSILFEDKKLRTDNQYYLKNIVVEIDYEELFNFILEIKNTINSISPKEIQNLRTSLKELS
ncbi:MAG: hypothetical protein PHU51_00350 [Candidatus Nanoarchaeia archaeon]|nr:hypothetical protein [Candidatus Nanoarchaeia archaeon]